MNYKVDTFALECHVLMAADTFLGNVAGYPSNLIDTRAWQ